MTTTMIDLDKLIAYLDAHDDAHDICRNDLIILAAAMIRDDQGDPIRAGEVLISYELCPMHACDIQICDDDDDPDCRALRHTL